MHILLLLITFIYLEKNPLILFVCLTRRWIHMPLGFGMIGPLPPTITSVKGPLAPTITSVKGPRQPTITSVTGPLSPTVTLTRGPVETKPNVYIPICKHIGPCSITIFVCFSKHIHSITQFMPCSTRAIHTSPLVNIWILSFHAIYLCLLKSNGSKTTCINPTNAIKMNSWMNNRKVK